MLLGLLMAVSASPAAAQAVNEEAWLFIPEEWRARIQPLASVPLPSGCNAERDLAVSDTLAGSPPGALSPVFVLECGPALPAFEAAAAGQAPTLHWLSAETLDELTRMPDPNWWTGSIFVVDHTPRILLGRSQDLLDVAGDVLSVHREGGGVVAISGRVFLDNVSGVSELVDIQTQQVLFRRVQPSDGRAEAFTVLRESGARLEIAGIRRDLEICVAPYAPCRSELVVVDANSNRERSIDIVASRDSRLRLYGARQVVFDQPAAAENDDGVLDVTIVDLDSMEVVWRGQPDEAPLPRAGRQCISALGMRHSASGSPAHLPALQISLDGEGFSAIGGYACAMAGDGEFLLIGGPRMLHLYRVGYPQ